MSASHLRLDSDSDIPVVAFASFTGTAETRVCGRDTCRRSYGSCSIEEKSKWKRVGNSRNTDGDAIRWVCGRCLEYYCNKSTTRRQDESIDVNTTIEANVAAAQRGRGHRRKVQVVGQHVSSPLLPAPSLSSIAKDNGPNVRTRGRTYDSPMPTPNRSGSGSGYTGSHAQFHEQNENWARKASAVGNVKEVVAIKVFIGQIKPGHKNIVPVGGCVEGAPNIDAHIGGDELHSICYNTLRPSWLAWSGGYDVPLAHTTLRGVKVHAAIAGMALRDQRKPAKHRDAILHLLFKPRGGKGGERTIKYEQVELAIVIEQEDIQEVEKRKQNRDDLDIDDSASEPVRTRRRLSSFRSHSRAVSTFTDDRAAGAITSGDAAGTGVMRESPHTLSQPTTPPASSKRRTPVEFVTPEREHVHSAMRVQERNPGVENMVHFFDNRSFRCLFYNIPYASYDGHFPEEAFDLDDPEIDVYSGVLHVDFAKRRMERGAFKTSHPGSLSLDDGTVLPGFTDHKVCVKQLYETQENRNAIGRIKGRHELNAFSVECNCLQWASVLLDFTYQFISREIVTRGEPPFRIPELRFTHVMIAIVQDTSMEKVFLVEEWINSDEKDYPFIKYIDNRLPSPCVPNIAPPTSHNTGDFLAFAQHVQWEKSRYSAFTSDYQGAGNLLTDPQITSNPNLGNKLFGEGNLPGTFVHFRKNHHCNHFCTFFGLKLDRPHSGPTNTNASVVI